MHHHHVRHERVGVRGGRGGAVRRRAHEELAVHLKDRVNGVALLRVALLEAGVDHIAARHLACDVGDDHHLQHVLLVRHHVVRRREAPERLLLIRRRASQAVRHREHVAVLRHQRGQCALRERPPVEVAVVVRVIRGLRRIVAVGGAGRSEVEGQCRVVPRCVADIQLVAVRQVVGVGVELVDRKREVVRRVAAVELLQVVLLRHVLQERRERNGIHALDYLLGLFAVFTCDLLDRSRLRSGRIIAVEVIDRRVHDHHVRHERVGVGVRHVDAVRRRTHVELAVDLEDRVDRVALLRVALLEA